MGITCKPLGTLKKELKKIEAEQLKEKAAIRRTKKDK